MMKLHLTHRPLNKTCAKRFWNSWRNFGGFGLAHDLQDFSAEAGFPAHIWRIWIFRLFIKITFKNQEQDQ